MLSIDKGSIHCRPSVLSTPPSRPQEFSFSLVALSSLLLFPPVPPSPTTPFLLYKMVSASKAARLAKRGDEKKSKSSKDAVDADGNPLPPDEQPATSGEKMKEVEKLTAQMDKHGLSDRVTTGVLASQPSSRDAKVNSASLVFHGRVLITDTVLELNYGRRYGLLGENGCGKSTLLKSIASREYPIPEQIDIYLLNEGAPPTDQGALEWVVKQAELQMETMEQKAEKVLEDYGPESPILLDLYDVSSVPYPFSRCRRC